MLDVPEVSGGLTVCADIDSVRSGYWEWSRYCLPLTAVPPWAGAPPAEPGPRRDRRRPASHRPGRLGRLGRAPLELARSGWSGPGGRPRGRRTAASPGVPTEPRARTATSAGPPHPPGRRAPGGDPDRHPAAPPPPTGQPQRQRSRGGDAAGDQPLRRRPGAGRTGPAHRRRLAGRRAARPAQRQPGVDPRSRRVPVAHLRRLQRWGRRRPAFTGRTSPGRWATR